MSTEAASLPHDVATLQELVGTLTATIETQQRELEQLKHYLERLLRDRFGPRREQLDPNQMALFETDGDAAPCAAAPAEDESSETVAVRRRKGRGRKLPPDLPRERVEHDLSEAEKTCPGCGDLRERIGGETSEQLEFVPATLKVVEHVRWKYACRKCAEHVAVAPPAPKPVHKGLPGPGLLAQLVVSKSGEHLPLYRLEDEFVRYGLEISRGTLCRWMAQTAALVEPLYLCMVRRVLASAVVHTDDTTVPVLDRELPRTRTGRFWAYCGDAEHPDSVYDYTPSRKRDGPATFLAGFAGYLQADAYGGYDGIYATDAVRQVLCWAHARRKFFDARTVQPAEAHAALAFIGRLYHVERELTAQKPEDFRTNAESRRAWHALRREVRQERSLPILAELHAWLTDAARSVLPRSPVGQAIAYALPRWGGLVRYCEDGRLAIDNNLAERTLRGCAIGRKNWLFVGSDHSGRTAAILYSLLASAKRNEVEPWAYLRDVIDTLARLSAAGTAAAGPSPEALAPLLPDAWLVAHPAAHRCYSR